MTVKKTTTKSKANKPAGKKTTTKTKVKATAKKTTTKKKVTTKQKNDPASPPKQTEVISLPGISLEDIKKFEKYAKALKQGKRIRRKAWAPGKYIKVSLVKAGPEGISAVTSIKEDLEKKDWEILD